MQYFLCKTWLGGLRENVSGRNGGRARLGDSELASSKDAEMGDCDYANVPFGENVNAFQSWRQW